MKKLIAIFISLLALQLTACTSLGRLDHTATTEIGTSVFVIGVKPENYRISVFPGDIKDGAFKQNIWRAAAVFDSAQNGYVLGKAEAGDTLAITWLRIVDNEGDLLGSDYRPCEGINTLVFSVPNEKVLYITDVAFSFNENNSVKMDFTQNLEAARAHVDANFPLLKGRLEQGSYEYLPVSDTCKRTIYIPAPVTN